MPDISLLNETFELYYRKAKECHEKKDMLLAKRYYFLAAEQMLKMAKASDNQLQKARFSRAKSLIEMAESIDLPKKEKSVNKEVEAQKNEKISLEEALSRLENLEGLGKVKAKVRDWVDQIKVFQKRKERGLSVPDMSYHLVFTGNPGTGKTTVARLMAQIYCALGILSEGSLVEVDRGGLVAGYVGQTAEKTREVIKKALGGVLFIDEAYSLVGGGSNDFGQESIETILKEMEDKRDDLVVIVAGYDGPMEKFINSNPGLKSRFKNFIHFDDYDGKELYNIFVKFCQKSQYVIEEDVKHFLQKYFYSLYQNRGKNFGNGRDVRNFFENVVTKQSKRIAQMDEPSDSQLQTITMEDIPLEVNMSNDEKIDKNEKIEEKFSFEKEEEKNEYKFDWDNLPAINFDDIAGLENVKEVVKVKVLLPLQRPDAFEGYVRKSGGGLLLYGPPGTGKTMIAAAIANEIGAKFCSIKPSDLLNTGIGNTEKAVKSLFLQARQFPCAVIYFDEMDSISSKSTRAQYAKQLRSELLSQLQGIEDYGKENKNILFLIASTNKPWDVDSAFLRPGRFGTRIYIGLPDAPARQYMINRRMEKLKEKKVVEIRDFDIENVVKNTEGFNGADISSLLDKVEEISAIRGLKTNEKFICNDDFVEALSQTTPSVQKEDIEKILEWKKANG